MFRRPNYPPPEPYQFSSNRFENRGYDQGLTHYAANNSTAMAAPLEIDAEDIARLDNDITTQGFRDDSFRPSSPFASKYTVPKYDQIYADKENDYRMSNRRQEPLEDVGRLVADIAAATNSDPYDYRSPLQLRRSTSDAAKNLVITPPTSSSPEVLKEAPIRRPLGQLDQNRMMDPTPFKREPSMFLKATNNNNGALVEMQNMYEERIDHIKRSEAERFAALENEYKKRIAKLQHDMNVIVEKQDSVMRLKGEVEGEIQKDLDQARADLKRECAHRKAEKERFEKQIKDMQGKVEELQRKLKKYTAGFGPSNDKSSMIRSYESKITHLQQEHDQKIADLIKQFDREKHSALDIMKTRIKSEVNLLVPKIRNQCQQAFNKALVRCQEETANRYREKYGTIIRKMKEEHQAEKRFIQKQAKETAEHDKSEWQRRLKSKYEMKALELKNDCERRLIERMRKPANVSFMLSDSPNDDVSYGPSDISFL